MEITERIRKFRPTQSGDRDLGAWPRHWSEGRDVLTGTSPVTRRDRPESTVVTKEKKMTLKIVLGAILLALSLVEFYVLPKEKTCPSFWHSSPARVVCAMTMAVLFGVIICLFAFGK